MLDFSATDVAFAGFRFVRQHPLIVLIWAGLHFVLGALMGAFVLAEVAPLMAQATSLGAKPDPAAVGAMFGQLAPFYGLMLLFSLVFYPVVLAAAIRAVLEPDQSAFAYLRLGMDEVRQLLLILLVMLVAIGAEIALTLAAVILTAVLSLGGPIGGVIGALASVVLVLSVLAFGWVRLSLAVPMTFARKRVTLFGAWSLTRGRFWKMFGAYVLAWALAFVAYLLVALIIGAVGAALGVSGMGLAAFATPGALGALTPGRVILMGASGAANALLLPVLLMPMADIYRQVRPENIAAQLDVF